MKFNTEENIFGRIPSWIEYFEIFRDRFGRTGPDTFPSELDKKIQAKKNEEKEQRLKIYRQTCIEYALKTPSYMETQNETPPPIKGAFLKAMIKINNPGWTAEQIEIEFKRQMELKDKGDDSGCEMCSG